MKIRISQRAQMLAPSATLAVVEKARALRERGIDVISFGAGEPDFETPAHVRQAAIDAIEAGDTKYPAPVAGKTPLRRAICDYLKRYSALEYDPSQICVTVGAKDALHLIFETILDPGDEVILGVPYWVSYPEQVRLAGGVPVFIREAISAGGKLTAAQLSAAITPRTRALVLNSPSNPTGAVYSLEELEALADVLRDTDIVVVSDEIYHRLVFDGAPAHSIAKAKGMFERTLLVNGLSKTFAMTGWRLGYAAGDIEVIRGMTRLTGQSTSGATSFVQTAAVVALTGEQEGVEHMRAAYLRRATRMVHELSTLPGVRCVPPAGAFYCFPDVSGTFARLGVHDADGFAERVLEEAHVALVSGTPFGCPTHARLSYATSDAQVEEGLRRLRKLLG